MGDYITMDDIRLSGYQFDLDKDGPVFDKLIPAACAMFDTLAGVRSGYFSPAEEEATEITVRSLGRGYLSVPRFVGEIEGIAVPDGFTAPHYVVQGGMLWLSDSRGVMYPVGSPAIWPIGVAITVSARWGFDKTPEDVRQAVTELALAMFRSKDQAFSRSLNLDSRQLTFHDAIPARTKIVASKYKASAAVVAFV